MCMLALFAMNMVYGCAGWHAGTFTERAAIFDFLLYGTVIAYIACLAIRNPSAIIAQLTRQPISGV